MIAAGTGHRPDKLGGYGDDARRAVVGSARLILNITTPERVISGMAQGWDQALAQACVDLGIPFTAAIPFNTHGENWPAAALRRYCDLLERADRVVYVWKLAGYETETIVDALHARNRYMVDNAGLVIALYNGDPKGGTAACIRYAESRNVPIVNGWGGFPAYRDSGAWLI